MLKYIVRRSIVKGVLYYYLLMKKKLRGLAKVGSVNQKRNALVKLSVWFVGGQLVREPPLKTRLQRVVLLAIIFSPESS